MWGVGLSVVAGGAPQGENPHGCTPRPDSYPTSPSEPAYMPLNNFDTIRSYGSAGDELENLPQYSRDFVQNISKPGSLYHHHTPQINPLGTLRGSTLGSTVSSTRGSPLCSPGTATPVDTDSLHKPWKDALAHNLKDTYYENNKIQNGLYLLLLVPPPSLLSVPCTLYPVPCNGSSPLTTITTTTITLCVLFSLLEL
ncbi:hypothetical protein E2C01_095125 [Portunus trituberculatus]|uniref:Uncharacterized protein n=1 Tax=Portunus trituberculatus TaxID=210409 RepID=A0A5B7K2Y0_PORTR|nr:hypothetical protein [Portunus trituberculatus]